MRKALSTKFGIIIFSLSACSKETEYNHVYMLGAVSKYNKEELGDFIVVEIQ